MPNYVYCECRSFQSFDLSVPPGQPFPCDVEYDNSAGANAWVHLNVLNSGDQAPIQVMPGANIVTFNLPNFAGDTTMVVMKARLRDTNDPNEAVGTTLFAEEDQTDIAFYGLG